MKRFIYDALLLLILVMIGMSMNDSTTYVNKQDELNRFEDSIEDKSSIQIKKGINVMNQIEDNHASIAAQNVSEIIKGSLKTIVLFVNSIFESITKT